MGLFLNHEFDKNNRTKTVVIYGCGSSLNDLTDLDSYVLSQFDSVAFNWFCFSHIPVTYYLVREQANIPKRVHGEETVDNFYNLINKYYKKSCLVIHDLYNHSPNAYPYWHVNNEKEFIPNSIYVQDTKLKGNDPGVDRWGKENILKDGIYHGKTTLTNTLHFAVWMGYERIIFVGIDLYDSKYFWLKDNETRYSVKNKKKTKDSKHQAAKDTLGLIEKVKKIYPDIEMYTYNKKSLLSGVIGVWNS